MAHKQRPLTTRPTAVESPRVELEANIVGDEDVVGAFATSDLPVVESRYLAARLARWLAEVAITSVPADEDLNAAA